MLQRVTPGISQGVREESEDRERVGDPSKSLRDFPRARLSSPANRNARDRWDSVLPCLPSGLVATTAFLSSNPTESPYPL
jgi:hypothetical protein